jgi:tetratricopeptide (TPR) repeat protein
LGRIWRVLELVELQSEINRQAMTPVQQIFTYNLPVIQLNLLLGRPEKAEEALVAAFEAIRPPINQFLAFMEAILRARTGEFEQAESAVNEGTEAIERFKADYLAFQIPLSSAEIAVAREDWSAAAHLYQDALDQIQRSAVAIPQDGMLPQLYGICAQMHVRAGELNTARKVLEYAFKRDAAEPHLWVAQAMLQEAQGARWMALASVDYALAIWAEADADYVDYRDALTLRERLAASLD